jgi:uncharacterized protein (DUF2342 family)
MRRAAEVIRQGRNPLDDGGIVGLFASAEQRAVLDEVQALMSLLEGHGNFVMSELGRRHSGGVTSMVNKLLGFEMKMRQYDVGERFVRAVVDEAGLSALDPAWRAPELLPTLDEMQTPHQWLERVGGGAITARAIDTA